MTLEVIERLARFGEKSGKVEEVVGAMEDFLKAFPKTKRIDLDHGPFFDECQTVSQIGEMRSSDHPSVRVYLLDRHRYNAKTEFSSRMGFYLLDIQDWDNYKRTFGADFRSWDMDVRTMPKKVINIFADNEGSNRIVEIGLTKVPYETAMQLAQRIRKSIV